MSDGAAGKIGPGCHPSLSLSSLIPDTLPQSTHNPAIHRRWHAHTRHSSVSSENPEPAFPLFFPNALPAGKRRKQMRTGSVEVARLGDNLIRIGLWRASTGCRDLLHGQRSSAFNDEDAHDCRDYQS